MKHAVQVEADVYIRIRIKRSDHAKIVGRITHTKGIDDIITDAMTALEEKERRRKGSSK